MKKEKCTCEPADIGALVTEIRDSKEELKEIFRFDERLNGIVEYNIEEIYTTTLTTTRIVKDDYKKKGMLWLAVSHSYHQSLVQSLFTESEAMMKKGAKEEDIEYGVDYVTQSEAKRYAKEIFGSLYANRDFVDDIIDDFRKDGTIRANYIKQ